MNVFAQRLLDVAKACRETRFPRKFTMARFSHPCGTPACALGNYAYRTDLQDFLRVNHADGMQICDTAGEEICARRMSTYFGIELGEWDELFTMGGCDRAQTPEAAAEYIERFVARKWPAPNPPNWRAMMSAPVIPEHVKSEDACHV